MNASTGLLLDLFVIFLAAKLAAELFKRIQQPPVIGELLVSVLIGPSALALIGTPDAGLIAAFYGDAQAAQEAVNLLFHLLAELGVVVLLFFVGLETRITDILKVDGRAGAVAVLGVVVPFVLGYALMGPLLGYPKSRAPLSAPRWLRPVSVSPPGCCAIWACWRRPRVGSFLAPRSLTTSWP